VPMLPGLVDAVVGVDTHRDTHTAAVLDRNGGLLATTVTSTDQAGYPRSCLAGCGTERQAAAAGRWRAPAATGQG
jgi:hypothetical protein